MILTIFIAAIQIGLALQASKNLKRFRMLQVSERAEDYEKLSVCVPMRNEAKNADRILSELIREKELIHEIWILDDGSTDDTQQILLKYQKRYPELVHIMRGKEKPDDWKGKIWAMRQLAGSATAELILFLDADVHIHEGAIIALLTEQRVTNAAYLSIFPKQNTSSATDMLINHIYTSLLHLLPMQLIDDARYPGAVAGCGQVQLVHKKTLASIGGLESVRTTLHDGLQIARKVKKAGGEVRFAYGGKLFSGTMYESFSEAWKGFRRNAFEATGGYLPLLATTSILVISFVLAPITIVAGKLPAYIIVASSVALYGNYLRISKRFDLSPFFIVRLPFSVILSTLLQWSSVVRHTLGMKETWRGRKV
jgi:glycosyltransferase involved in cell wall biosynthesis